MKKEELELEFKNENIASDVDFDIIATCVNNDHIPTSPEVIRMLANKYKKGNEITMMDLIKGMTCRDFGLVPENLTIPHEAGHIVVMEVLNPGCTILGTKLGYSGFTSQDGTNGLVGAMGGYAGEMIGNGKASSGASMDIKEVEDRGYGKKINELVGKATMIILKHQEEFNKVCELLKNNDYITQENLKGMF